MRFAIRLKYIVVISLLVLLFLQTGGSYIIFCTELFEARHEATEYVNGLQSDREKVTTLTFQLHEGKIAASDLVFEDDDEFSYQGKMYDVISTEKYKDHITFRCYTDSKETELNTDLCEKIDAGRDKASEHKERSHIKLAPLDFIANDPCDSYFLTENIIQSSMIYRGKQQTPAYKAIISPPPELLS